MAVFADHDHFNVATPHQIHFTPEQEARILAQMAEHQAIHQRLDNATVGLAQEHPHQWAGMNSDMQLTLADSLEELLDKLRPDGDKQRNVAVEYLDPDPPEIVL